MITFTNCELKLRLTEGAGWGGGLLWRRDGVQELARRTFNWTSNRKIGGSVVQGQVGLFVTTLFPSLDKKLCTILSLFTQV